MSIEKESIFENLQEESAVEGEAENFKDFLIDALSKQEAYEIVRKIESGEINVELDKKRIIEAGKAAEKTAEKEGEEYDETDHLLRRTSELAEQLIEKYGK